MKNEKAKIPPGADRKNIVKISIIIFAVLNIIAVLYVQLSKNFYYWSTAESWNIAIKIAQGAYHPNLFKEVYKSILNFEVNYLSALPSALFAFIFGESRLVYILSLINCYVAPFFVCVFFLIRKIGKAPVVSLIITFLSLPAILYMALLGFAEVGGLAVGMLCMYLYLCDNKSQTRFLRYITIGLLLTLATIWSHVYIFFSVAFVAAMIADSIIQKKSALFPVISLLCMILLLALFFKSYISERIISLYGSTSTDPGFIINLKFFLRYFGLLFLIALAVQSVVAIRKNNSEGILFLWMHILLCFIMIITTRTHGQLHILMYMPALASLCILCIKQIDNITALILAVVLALSQTIAALIPRVQPTSVEEIKEFALFPSFSLSSKVRNDYESIITLKNTLDTVVQEGEYLGVLAYSNKLNPDLLNNAQISSGKLSARRNYIAFTIPYFDVSPPNISPLCNANYMLVVSPLQSDYDNQIILSQAVDSFLNYTDIARAYTELYEYSTKINGMEIKLFKRTRAPYEFEKQEFLSKLGY